MLYNMIVHEKETLYICRADLLQHIRRIVDHTQWNPRRTFTTHLMFLE